MAEHSSQPSSTPRLVRPDAPPSPEGSMIEPKPGVDSAVGTVVSRRYEILDLLGAGRRGRVYIARDRLTETTVALKRFRVDEPKMRQAAELAMAAAERVATIRHESIVRVFDVGEDAAGPYIVSEFIDGTDAARRVAAEGAMGLRQAARVIEAVGEALSYAHERELFHGSVRGSNILFQPEGRPKLADFALGGLEASDFPRARRQDVKGLVRTLCQLLTGISVGSVDLRELPEAIQPAVRAALGPSVASQQPSVEAFLRELRASELEAPEPPEIGEMDAVERGRRAELSGSFAAMREAGEEALERNSESAEAMVLLRRADRFKAQRDELIEHFKQAEQAFDYTAALEALSKLQRRFGADHQTKRLIHRREALAELTRLSGIAEQLTASGHLAASLEPWRKIVELSPEDPRARAMLDIARRARFKRRVLAATGTSAVLVALAAGGALWWLNQNTPMAPAREPKINSAGAAILPAEPPVAESRPTTRNPLVRTPAEREAAVESDDSGLPEQQPPTAESTPVEEIAAPAATPVKSDDVPAEFVDGVPDEVVLAKEALERAERDAVSARAMASKAGAEGLAPNSFAAAQQLMDLAVAAQAAGEVDRASSLYASARGQFVTSAARAGEVLSRVQEQIDSLHVRQALASLDRLEGLAPAGALEKLREDLERRRSRSLAIAPGVAIDFRYIEPGVFVMGADPNDSDRRFGEDQRQVRLEHGAWLARTELTRGQLAAIRGLPEPEQSDLPAVGLTLDEARSIAAELTERFDGTFFVPTEELWEYACRADRSHADEAGWSILNSDGKPHVAGEFGTNPWGLVDMIGNAAELVESEPIDREEGVSMTRGGSYLSPMSALRASARHELVRRDRPDPRVGLRLAWTP
ncbi:MAG TPA: hypothetical protein ENJ00_09375 [Phycisphaerales bacterium]|nr:hypothetical protein [Phycisphaerales bacterium]